MKTIIFILLLICSSHINVQGEILSIDSISTHYVYMEFQTSFDTFPEKKKQFIQECERQSIFPHIADHLHSIYFEDQPPLWRIVFPLNDHIEVAEPLHISTINNWFIASRIYQTNNIENTIEIFEMRLHEMNFYRNGPVIFRWIDERPTIDILLPIGNIPSFEILRIKISRFLLIISVILFLLFGSLLIFSRKGKRISNLLFALFLFSISMVNINWIIGYFRYTVLTHFPHILNIGEPFHFIIYPLLFLYTLSILQKNFDLKKKHLVHIIPFAVVLFYWSVKFYRFPADIKRELYLNDSIFSGSEQFLGTLLENLQLIGYLGAAIFLFHLYKRRLKNQHSALQAKQYTWLGIVLYGFLFINYIGYLKHILYHYMGIYSHVLYIVLISSYLIFSLVIIYYAFHHPELFTGIDLSIANTNKISLSDNVFNNYRTKLKKYMDENRPYLIPDLTIQKLADLVSIPPRSLSEVINKGFNQNFFEFINSYRIKDAKRLIADSYMDKKTILEIIYTVGYNNKSVFNSVFKKITGKTPTEYRSEVMNNNPPF
ncbi:AraC family transcriptional regulator [candidate division KSB1 bacterium]|nr:AraC family transcriptional regulator [candidate division KSB1 bacterium]